MNLIDDKEKQFESLIELINQCDLCERLCNREKVMSKYNGNINTKVLFIAEAPGRLGADKTKIPLFGDRTGDNFDGFLKNIGWSRDQIFITNAVLCNPRDTNGNNDKPSNEEIMNCSYFLEMIIKLIQPTIIVTLGLCALNSLKNIQRHDYTLKDFVGKKVNWNGMFLVPLYHPAPRALLHRSIIKQRSDYIALANIINPVTGLKRKNYAKIKGDEKNEIDQLAILILYILQYYKRLSYFKLTKLLYLVDCHYILKMGDSFTREIYLRQKDGPWPPALSKKIKLLARDNIIEVTYEKKEMFIKSIKDSELGIPEDDRIEIENVIHKYKDYDNYKIKVASYRTPPMVYILEKEKEGGVFLNKPVIFNGRSISDMK